MLAMFQGVKPYITHKTKADYPRADNLIFRLHYRATFSILLVCVILVSSYNYIDSSGSAIQCLYDKGTGIPGPVINRYCWIMSTFTLPDHYEGPVGIEGGDKIHYGVGTGDPDSKKKYHAYYQWVPLMLSMQAIMFYFPHWLWKKLENGRMKHIIVGLNVALADDQDRLKKVNQLGEYMRQRMKETTEHRSWARKFFFCEVLNFINVIAQMFITDSFLGGEFSTFGTEVLNFARMDPEDRVDPMSRVFPRMTKCTFHKYGSSGTIQNFDALCVLGMNILNEKIYIFLWFWYIVLAVATAANLILRLMQYFMPSIRDRLVKLENLGYLDRNIPREDIDSVVGRLAYSDWLILYYLAQSMEKKNFGALISNLADDLPSYPYPELDDVDGSTTPPPGFEDDDDVEKNKKRERSLDRRSSGRSTLRATDHIPTLLRKSFSKRSSS